VDDVTSRSNVCTANDVDLAQVTATSLNGIDIGPGNVATCIEGSLVTVALHSDLVPQADRYDIGIFVNPLGVEAYTGPCLRWYLTPLEPPFNGTGGNGPFRNLDNDLCGDLKNSDGNVVFNLGTLQVLCESPSGSGNLELAYCTSWDNVGKGGCTDYQDVAPNTKSKCRCGNAPIANIKVIPKPIQMTKTATPPCFNAVGDIVQYAFNITNTQTQTYYCPVITDAKVTGVSCPPLGPNGLQPGQSLVCTASYAVTAADIAAGSIFNEATLTMTRSLSSTGTCTGQVVAANATASVRIFNLEITVAHTDETACDKNDGTITVTSVVGQQGTVTYKIASGTFSSSQTSQSFIGLAPGAYTVSATDSKGCTDATTVTIASVEPVNPTLQPVTPRCPGTSVQLVYSPPGGVFSGTGVSQTGLFVAPSSTTLQTYPITYTVTQGNCHPSASITIQVNPTIVLSTSVTNVTCNSGNGSVDLSVANSSGRTFSYTWSNGATTQDLAAVGAGTYSVTVTETTTGSSGCTASTSATVAQPTDLTLSLQTTQIAQCGGTGSIAATAGGGVQPYKYQIKVASSSAFGATQTSATFSGLLAGTYVVRVQDANGCIQDATSTINAVNPPIVTLTGPSSPLCPGQTFQLTGTPAGGVYSGAPGSSYVSAGGLFTAPSSTTVQNYIVTYTVTQGSCIVPASVTIQVNPTIPLTITSTNVKCYNTLTGAVSLTVPGNGRTFSYAWSNGATTEDLSGLGPGTYTVTVTETTTGSAGCTASAFATVTQPTQVTLSLTPSTVTTCGGSDGSITAVANGGVGSYEYQIATVGSVTGTYGPWQSSGLFSNLSGGTYSVRTRDANVCTATGSAVVTSPNAPSVTLDAVAPVCPGGFTRQLVGKPPAPPGVGVYSVSGAGSVNSVTGVYTSPATSNGGTDIAFYSYQIDNCHGSASQPIQVYRTVWVGYSKTDVLCNGGSTGTITLSLPAGTYTYLWNDGATVRDRPAVPAGTYSVTVTESTGCVGTSGNIVILQPKVLTVSLTTQPTPCDAPTGGSAQAFADGGSPLYNYVWSDGVTTSSSTRANLPAGSIGVTVHDSNACTASASANVPATGSIIVNGFVLNTTCALTNGAIALIITGNNQNLPYKFQWTNGATTQSIGNLVAGTYSVTVTDSVGLCSGTATFVVGCNCPPIAVDDFAITHQEVAVVIDELANDSAGCWGPLNTACVKIVTPARNGTVFINSNGTTTYTPFFGFYGNDQFVYSVCDQRGNTVSATVFITVIPKPCIPHVFLQPCDYLAANPCCNPDLRCVRQSLLCPIRETWVCIWN